VDRALLVLVALARNAAPDNELAGKLFTEVEALARQGRGSVLRAMGALEDSLLVVHLFPEQQGRLVDEWKFALLVGAYALESSSTQCSASALRAVVEWLWELTRWRFRGGSPLRAAGVVADFLRWIVHDGVGIDGQRGSTFFDILGAPRPELAPTEPPPPPLVIPEARFDDETLAGVRSRVVALREKHAEKGGLAEAHAVAGDLIEELGDELALDIATHMHPGALYPFEVESEEQPDLLFARALFQTMRRVLKQQGKLTVFARGVDHPSHAAHTLPRDNDEDEGLAAGLPTREELEELRQRCIETIVRRSSSPVERAYSRRKEALYERVTEAILRAECLPAGSAEAMAAIVEVGALEEQIAEITPAKSLEGDFSRLGAVRAALSAGNPARATELMQRYRAELTDEAAAQLTALLENK
jgi:hypothetical protein